MAQQPTKTILDLFLEALAIQAQSKQQGKDISPLEVAKRLKAIGQDAGYTMVDLSDQIIELAFIGYGRIWWDGSEWHWSGNP